MSLELPFHIFFATLQNEVDPSPRLRDARLMENDLRDGLKLLILQEGRFWPARLNSTQLPDVYGIVMEKQRGNRPQILPRDDILKEAVRPYLIPELGEIWKTRTLTSFLRTQNSFNFRCCGTISMKCRTSGFIWSEHKNPNFPKVLLVIEIIPELLKLKEF